MEINDELINHLAHLSRLEFEGEEKNAIQSDLNRIVDFIDQLSEVNTEGVEPLIFMTNSYNVLREDAVKETVNQSDALKNAAHHDSDYFKIPKVLKK